MADAPEPKPRCYPYTVRVSPRARNVRLTISLDKGLEIVIPRGYSRAKIPAILERKKRWLRAAHQRTEEKRRFLAAEPPWRIPAQVALLAAGMTWQVEAVPSRVSWVSVAPAGTDRLLLRGNAENAAACRAALQRWLMRQAREFLGPWLMQVSREVALPFDKVYIRRQKTRWASCSSRRAISLNAKLLFLDRDVVRYIFIHELCHTVHLNHSPKFWQLVRKHEPRYRELDAALKTAWRQVPGWFQGGSF